MFGKKTPENLSVEELEKLLLIKRRQSRVEKFRQMSAQGQTINETLFSTQEPAPAAKKTSPPKADAPPKAPRTLRDSLLLTLEVVALAGLVGVLVASYFNLKELNNEVAEAQQMVVESQMLPTATPTPPIALAILPGGHSPPTASQGAMPDIPAHLQQWVQPQSGTNAAAPNLKVDQSVNPPTRIVVPKINVDAPIVADVSWEALKMGVGHLPGSANPGERGNLYLAAHNDIFGEIFRYLDDLEPGDEYFIYSGEENFRYVVKEKRIIDPTDVEVMWPTTEPVATLQTCYPYLVDTHRLVIIGELAE